MEDVHSCSYFCDRPACVRAQRDQLRGDLERERAAYRVACRRADHYKAMAMHPYGELSIAVDMAEARRLGAARQAVHPLTDEQRASADPDYQNVLGAAVELAVEEWLGLKADWSIRPAGDGGIDFNFVVKGVRLTMDVKGARIPKYLLLKQDKAHQAAHILVLAGVNMETGIVTFHGWEHRQIMRLMPVRDFGVGPSHYRERPLLRRIVQLQDLVEMGQ